MSDGFLEELTALMPPHEGAGDDVDWEAAGRQFGVSFPCDYRGFVERFGAGSISESLFLCIPRPAGGDPEPLTVGRLPERVVNDPTLANWQDPDLADRHRPQDMLLWGSTCGADTLAWLPIGDTPEAWPVAVWERHGGGWALYPHGMVEFLLRVIRADMDRCPLSDESLWGYSTPRFLHLREEDRLREAGIDPATGRPSAWVDRSGD
ncbi:hypothetical protein ACFQ61_27860 [Streptomyces sp. NPDC056500]|uniref:hypothetical protein n=1 Tax=Streptomyces sp. NPDC056500 TaxID=3345840 RepID=UPI0036A63175